MLATTSTALALSLARGVLKLSVRLDRLQAEKEAVRGDLALPMPPLADLSLRPMLRELAELAAATAGQVPDPLGPEARQRIEAFFVQGEAPVLAEVLPLYRELLPGRVIREIDPDSAFLRRLGQLGLDDDDLRLAAFYIAPGNDGRKVGHAWRVGLAVADAVVEFGAENTALFLRDARLQAVAGAVLGRFAEPDLATFDSWQGLLRHTLQATLNGALDARSSLLGRIDGGEEWVAGVLDALADAREEAGDNFVVGLLRGQGYPLLVGAMLDSAAAKLGREGASDFQRLAGDLLREAAPLVAINEGGFQAFFEEHWGDLLRAGLASLEAHGPRLLAGEAPLLREALLAMVRQLARTPGAHLFSRETVAGLVESAVAGLVSRGAELAGDIDEAWLRELITRVAGIVADQGIRKAFTREGIESLIQHSLSTLAEHPELVGVKPGFVPELVGEILRRVGQGSGLGARELATAAVEGALEMLADSPGLLEGVAGRSLAPVLGDFAGLVAERVRSRGLTRAQGVSLFGAFAEAVRRNPEIFLRQDEPLARAVLEALLAAVGDDDARHLLDGEALSALAWDLFSAFATHGRDRLAAFLAAEGLPALTTDLTELLAATLVRARAELGRQLDRTALPAILAGVVDAWLLGLIADPDDPNFEELFHNILEQAPA